MRVIGSLALALVAWLAPAVVAGQTVEWPSYASDVSGTKYSPLDQINESTVHDLEIVWRQPVIPDAIRNGDTTRGPLASQNTPLMAGGLLYVTTGFGSVAALDPTTGDVVWHDDENLAPRSGAQGSRRADLPESVIGVGDAVVTPGRGRPPRGVAYWTDGDDARVLALRGPILVALNAKTGLRYPDFGDGGEVDLRQGLIREFPRYNWYTAPLVVNDSVIIGSIVPDILNNRQPATKESPRGDVRAFDLRTGELIWTFHTVPLDGQFGIDTWGIDPDSDQPSWEYTGNTNLWAHPTADPELGYVYLPLSTPANDYYGGHRPGNNLFGESLVCVDAETGERIWHFQAVHHGVWDYDFPASAILLDIVVDGRAIKAVAVVSKQAFTYVFDRVTGEPVWPIEERPVPPSNVPGEQMPATQPFPTKPPAFDLQGVRIDDLIDFTPELRAEAIEILDQYEWGPLFTPPTLIDPAPGGKKGTIVSPGVGGGANWQGAGADPETGILYVTSVYMQNVVGLTTSQHPRSDVRYVREAYTSALGPQGLPLFKPPYGRITAIDLNAGEILWQIPNGEGPRGHPALKDLDLPWLGQHGRASVLVTKALVFAGEGANVGLAALTQFWGDPGGKMFRAYDKRTGEVVWEMELPGGTSGSPMTYMVDGRQYIVVAVGWRDVPAEWVALALPQS